jgi:hypothetical protein
MVVEYSKEFIKNLKKVVSKTEAITTLRKLNTTSPSEGDFVANIGTITIREKRLKTFRFYFINKNDLKHVISREELKDFLIKFVALSKKNNQQEVINKLKEDLKKSGFMF